MTTGTMSGWYGRCPACACILGQVLVREAQGFRARGEISLGLARSSRTCSIHLAGRRRK
jgi:hypothetical protein